MRYGYYFIALLFLLSLSVVSALDCQYTVTKEYTVQEERFYQGNSLLDGKVEIVNTDVPNYITVNFEVYNSLDFGVDFRISYNTVSNWYGNGGGSADGYVGSNEYVTLKSQHNTGGDVVDVDLQVLEPSGITKKLENVVKQNTTCKICADNKICKNDGDTCLRDGECGSNICNIDGYCGDIKIVPCSLPKRNCNDQYCLTPNVKSAGQSYYCDFECEPGLTNIAKNNICGDNTCQTGYQNCNNETCLQSDVKKSGEKYSCEFECETGLWNIQKNKCGFPIYYFVIGAIIVVIILGVVFKPKKHKHH